MAPCRVANGPMSTDAPGKPTYSTGNRTAAAVQVNLHTKRTTMNAQVAGPRPARKMVPDPSQESTGRTIMKTRTLTLCALVALLLTVIAGQPRPVKAQDTVFMGADLGGLLVHFDNNPRRAWVPPPPPRHYRSWGPPPPPPHYRSWGPPPHYRSWGPPPARYRHPQPYYRPVPPPSYPYGRPHRHW